MSAAALVDEYGLDGLYGVDSVNRCGLPSSRSPYTSSVEMWCSRTSCARTASSTVNVPTTLACRNGSGRASALSTWVSAAKCTTASASATSLRDQVGVGDVALHQSDLVFDRDQ